MRESASFLSSILSFFFESASRCASASLIIHSMSASVNPPEDLIVTELTFPEALSFAETCIIPDASISNVTSI